MALVVEKHLEISEAWLGRNRVILHSNPAPVITYLEKRETPGREKTVISLSGRQARVGCEGFRHKPQHSMGLLFLCGIQERKCCEPVLSSSTLEHHGNTVRPTGDWQQTQAELPFSWNAWKNQHLAKNGTSSLGKTAIGGYLSVPLELTEIQSLESRDPGWKQGLPQDPVSWIEIMAKQEHGKRHRVVGRGMGSITQQAVPQPARLGAVSGWQMGLVAANHPFSDFADFTQSHFNNRRKEWDVFS